MQSHDRNTTLFSSAAGGRVGSCGEGSGDRNLLACAHLWPFIGALTGTAPLFFLAPVVFWFVRKDQSPLVDDQGREIINVTLTLFVLLLVPVIGWLVLLVWGPVWLVSSVRAAMVSQRGEYFRYPMTIRFLS